MSEKLKPMSEKMIAVADGIMSLRSDPVNPEIKASLLQAIDDATPELVAAGFNVFNRGPAKKAVRDTKDQIDAECAHYELDKLRRMMGLEKPPAIETRGPGGGGGR
jgi:hypothetical protein